MAPTDSDYRRFVELASFQQNQTLSAADQAWMAHYLRQHPHLQAELKLDAVVRAAIQSIQPPEAESVLQERFMARWSATRSQPAKKGAGWWAWLHSWKQGGLRVPAVVALLAAVLQVAQLAYIGVAALGPATMASRGVPGQGSGCDERPVLRIRLRPDAPWEDVALLIRHHDASLRHGPSESGEVWLAVSSDKSLEGARASLAQSPLVENATVVPALKDPACKP